MNTKPFRIVVTGSKGDVGEYAVDYARKQGASVLAVDIEGRGEWFDYMSADLADLGQAYDVLYGADAVIHLAAISDPHVYPAAKTFTTNASITYNVFEAAAHLGIKRVVAASSIQVHHPAFPRARIKYRYLPFDEDHPVDAHDEYGMSKLVGEACADSFARHWGMTIVSLRITWSVAPQQMTHFPIHIPEQLPDPAPSGQRWLPTTFYIDARDCARACYLAATVDLPPAAHIPLILTARDSCADMPSLEIARRFFPEAEIRPGLEAYGGFGSIASPARAEKVLGFVPEFGWRESVKEHSHER